MSREEQKYNGWSNRPTWLTNLWMTNDESSYRYWMEQAREVWDDAKSSQDVMKNKQSQHDAACAELARRIRDAFAFDVIEDGPKFGALFQDLMQFVVDEIDCFEIAADWINGLLEDEEPEAGTSAEKEGK